MKKALTIILALALVMSLSVPVFAANPTDSRTDLSFILETAQPTYTVTIPGSLKLEIGDNVLPITVSDAVNLGGNNVVVTFEGTQYGTPVVKYALMLQFNDSITNAVYYKIFDMNDIDLQHGDGYTVPVAPGIALASFAGNGSAKIRINVPDQTGWAYPNVLYTGYITFGIKLEGSINASVSTIAPGTVQFV
ncbi:MAG: hypothetical protein FWG53_04515, partial [Clostridiales bacterium]|nr:hypothetical protein [Clostridiales bacterium]